MKHENTFKPLFLLVLTLFCFSCSESNKSNDHGLNGRVKSISEKYYDPSFKFGEWTNDNNLDYEVISLFDDNGKLLSVEYRDEDGEVLMKIIRNVINENRYEEITYDGDGDLDTKSIIDRSNDTLVSITYDEDGEIINKNKSYFKNNRIEKNFIENFDDNNFSKEKINEFKYNDQGILTSIVSSDSYFGTDTTSYIHLTFDEKNNWTKCLEYYSKYDDGKEPVNIIFREYEYY